MKYLNNEVELNEATKEGITIVDFYANWCGPCRMLSPVLEELEEENDNISIAKVDVDEARELAMKYKISAIPALLFFKDGELVSTEVGFMSKDDLLEVLKGIND
jgi:thioredoxin 1